VATLSRTADSSSWNSHCTTAEPVRERTMTTAEIDRTQLEQRPARMLTAQHVCSQAAIFYFDRQASLQSNLLSGQVQTSVKSPKLVTRANEDPKDEVESDVSSITEVRQLLGCS